MGANDRIQWFHKKVSEACYPNASHLSERFGISHRQAQRDIEYIRSELGAPIEYEKSRKGYFYREKFLLPVFIGDENDTDIDDAIRGIRRFREMNAEKTVLQMQLPYTAVLEIKDRLTVMSLRSFIVSDEPKHRYVCEFPSVELFLGIIMSMDADLKIISPDWLRHKLVEFAERILNNNKDEADNTEN